MNNSNNRSRRTIVLRLISSFVIALVVWFFVNGDNVNIVTRNILNVPVSIVNEDVLNEKNLLINNEVEYFVNLELRSTESNLDEINPSEITAEIDLGDIDSPGYHNVDVIVRGLSNKVILDQTSPETIEVLVNEIDNTEKFPVINTQGKPEEGYAVVSATSDTEVTLEGSDEQIKQVDRVIGTADVSNLSDDSYQFVQVHAVNKEGDILPDIICTPQTVEAQITIGVVKEVPVNIPQIEGAPAEGYTVTNISVDPTKVTITGKPDQIDPITSVTPQNVAIPTTRRDKSFTSNSELILPDGISLLDDKQKVAVSVTIEQIQKKDFTISTLEPVGIASDLQVRRIDPGSVSIQVEGTSTQLQALDASNLKGIIDCTGLGAGEHSLPISIDTGGISIVSIKPDKVEITLETK